MCPPTRVGKVVLPARGTVVGQVALVVVWVKVDASKQLKACPSRSGGPCSHAAEKVQATQAKGRGGEVGGPEPPKRNGAGVPGHGMVSAVGGRREQVSHVVPAEHETHQVTTGSFNQGGA